MTDYLSPAFPYEAAIFDLDGTLLDSLDVWARVDAAFFARRGMALPEDYAAAVSGLSVKECAAYTRERFHLPESEEEIWAEWAGMAGEEYAERVALKPGAAEYLRALRRAGVKLGIATMLPERFYAPCLKRHGLLELFSVIRTSYGGSGRGKEDGELFLEIARTLNVAPERCVAFDDVREGVLGAKAAGMRAVCFREPLSAHGAPESVADAAISAWSEAPRPANLPAARAVIFTAYCEGDPRLAYAPRPGDFVLAADGGYRILRKAGFACNELIGDFDSMPAPGEEALRVTHYPVEKDDTDTILCVNRALALGYDDILLVGGVGGRLDHTLANVQTLVYAVERHARIALSDGKIWMTALRNAAVEVPRRAGKLSVFALSESARGVTIEGAHYPLRDGTLTNGYPLGVSNSFEADVARVSVRDGLLLVVAGAEDT